MPTQINHLEYIVPCDPDADSFDVKRFIGYCKEEPFEVLGFVYKRYQIAQYCDVKSPFGDYSGLTIKKAQQPKGTHIIGRFSALKFKEVKKSRLQIPLDSDLLLDMLEENLEEYYPNPTFDDVWDYRMHGLAAFKKALKRKRVPNGFYDLACLILNKRIVNSQDIITFLEKKELDDLD